MLRALSRFSATLISSFSFGIGISSVLTAHALLASSPIKPSIGQGVPADRRAEGGVFVVSAEPRARGVGVGRGRRVAEGSEGVVRERPRRARGGRRGEHGLSERRGGAEGEGVLAHAVQHGGAVAEADRRDKGARRGVEGRAVGDGG